MGSPGDVLASVYGDREQAPAQLRIQGAVARRPSGDEIETGVEHQERANPSWEWWTVRDDERTHGDERGSERSSREPFRTAHVHDPRSACRHPHASIRERAVKAR